MIGKQIMMNASKKNRKKTTLNRFCADFEEIAKYKKWKKKKNIF